MLVQVFVNGRIYNSFHPLRLSGGMVVSGEKIVYTGDPERAKVIAREFGGEIIDLGRKVVIPGFVDSHMHMDGLGVYLNSLDLRGVSSIRELREKLKTYIESGGKRIVIGRGWDQELFAEKRWPTRHDIDDVSGDTPVILSRVCGHAALLNTAALDYILSMNPSSQLNRFIQKDEHDVPTGIVFEDMVYFVWEQFTRLVDTKKMLLEASRFLAMNGVTSVGFMSASLKHFRVLQELEKDKLLRTRVHLYIDSGEKEKIFDAGLQQGFGSSMVKINGIKFFADGSLGARTAYLSYDYSDDPGNRGVPIYSLEELTSILKDVVGNGLQPAVHAIGDAALDIVLSAMNKSGSWKTGGRIEHASIVRPEQVNAIVNNKVMVSVQPHFVLSDWWADARLGIERLGWLYPFKTMFEKGVLMGFATDSPVEPLDPRLTLYAAETRKGDKNDMVYKATLDESLDRRIALHLYTFGSSRLVLNSEIGVLEKGSYADFIIVDKDPLEIDDIRKMNILETYVGGERVF